MKILCVDTSDQPTRWCGVDESGLVDPVVIESGRRHDETLSSGVVAWLERNGWDELDGIAVVVGPGGFTGLRVGVAFATGFAAAKGIPVVPISAYEYLAAQAPEGVDVWALAFFTRGEYRARLMKGGAQPEALGDVATFAIGDAPAIKSPVLPLGDGYRRGREAIDAYLGAKRLENVDLLEPLEAFARVAAFAWANGRREDVLHVDVDYGAEFKPTPKPRN